MREMKDSGIKWIGEIPTSWKIMPNKYLMHKVKKICPIYEDEDILSLSMKGVIVRDLDAGGKMPKSFDGYQYVTPGNLLMCLFDIDVTPRCVGIIKQDGLTSPAYSQFATYNIADARYYCYYYIMLDNEKTLVHLAKNLRHSLTEEQLGQISVIVPPIDEQKHIADFLDYRLNKVDDLIAEVQAQIDTLEQYKRSVITETVTKGLNHNVVMKDSGIVWIGKVPAKWRVENAKYHFTQRQERATKEMVQLTASQKYGVVTQAEYMELTGARVVVVQKDFDILKKVCAGDFVIHMRSFQGGLEYSTKTGSISSAYVMLIPKESIAEPRYYRWFFKSSAYIDALSSTSNLVRDGQALRWANFIQLPITIPPADEQTQITNFLDAKCAEIDSIIANKKAQLETLDAYKKSLIFEYVTGKKEVPETVTVVSINPHVPLLAMVVDMLKKPRGEVVDQKLLYLCDVYLGLGLSTQYYRWDYGPFDKQLYSYINTLVSNGWYKVNIQNKAKVLVKAENHAEALEMYGNQLAQNKSDIEKLVQYFGEMRVSEIERFATLFAVWNDFIIDGIPVPSDNQIIDDVLTNWRPTKGRFSRDTWQNTLLKMKRDGIIPKGLGLHTLPKPEGGKSDA